MELSVVLPAYNEERRIGATLRAMTTYLQSKNHDYEIIVVDDGSTDRTVHVVQRHPDSRVRMVWHRPNRGKGYSVRQGMRAARKRFILFSDADLSTPIEELEKLTPLLRTHDVIVGSRNLRGSDIRVRQPFIRSTLGKMFPLLVRMLLLPGIHDTQCGFKLFKRDAAARILPRQTLDGFCFDVELLTISRRLGLAIAEVPVVWMNSAASTVNPARDSLRMLRDLFVIWRNQRRGTYGKEPIAPRQSDSN